MINCLQLMKELGYANKGQATKILGESKDTLTEAEARAILDNIGAMKITSANKERVLKAQTILASKEYLKFTDKVEVKKTTKKADKEPTKRTESEELEKYKELIKKLKKENMELKTENMAMKIQLNWNEKAE